MGAIFKAVRKECWDKSLNSILRDKKYKSSLWPHLDAGWLLFDLLVERFDELTDDPEFHDRVSDYKQNTADAKGMLVDDVVLNGEDKLQILKDYTKEQNEKKDS